MLNIKTDRTGNRLTIALEGLLDTKSSPQLKAVLTSKDFEGVTEVDFDFKDLEYLTSAGLRVILQAQQMMDDCEGTMTVKNVPDDIMEVFDMTGFTDVLTIVQE